MAEESREHRYTRFLLEEERAFERARSNAECAGPNQRQALAREWFEASARLIQEYSRSQMTRHEGEPLTPYPASAIWRTSKIMESLAAGRLPQAVVDANAAGGRPDRWPAERRGIGIAIKYIEFARQGRIADRSFIKTVCDAFKVDRTTVRGWLEHPDEFTRDMLPFYPEQVISLLPGEGARYHFNRTGGRTEGEE
ncbi:MAG: hypothetical protein AAGG47_13050 [Pseudomonadota bacterium]